MQLSSRQVRIFELVLLLATGKPVPVDLILKKLDCSTPTLTRALKDVRDTYGCVINYITTIHSYHLVSRGMLDSKALKKVSDALITFSSHAEIKKSKVILDKEIKKSTSFSLRMDCKKKISALAIKTGLNRTEILEQLIDNHIEDLERSILSANKNAQKKYSSE